MRALRWIVVALAVGCDEADPELIYEPTRALYGARNETRLVPFPSDRYTVADSSTRTGLRVVISPETTADTFVGGYPVVAERLGELDGFSTSGGFAVSFEGPIDASAYAGPQGGKATLEVDPFAFVGKDAPLVLVDVDEASPERGRTFALVPRYYAQAADGFYPHDEYTVVARPLVPLAAGRRYLFAVTTHQRDERGSSIVPSDETRALLDGEPVDEYAKKVQDGLEVLASQVGIPKGDVVLASVFTTATVTDELIAVTEELKQELPPQRTASWEVESTDETGSRVRFVTRFHVPEYRSAARQSFVIQDGRPVQQSSVELEMFLVFSDRDVSGPRPVAIYQHGLGGDKDGCWGTAERLADLGVAVVAIDSPQHGSRGDGMDSISHSVFTFFGIDPVTAEFDLGRARDNFRQMTIDQHELVRFVESQADLDLLPVGAPDGVPDLDVSRFLYIGHSFGSVQGPAIFAVAPQIEHAVWNVGGAGVMLLLEDSGTFSLLVNGIKPPATTDGELARFFSATQAIVDPGDGLNYARYAVSEALPGHTLRKRSVLLQEVIDDGIVPNSSTEALARAAGMSLLEPVRPFPGVPIVASPSRAQGPFGSTAIVTQFDRMNGGEPATHGELIFAPEGQAQYVEFFRSALESGVGTVVAAP